MVKLLSIVASLTIITSVCGLALGALYEGTKDRIALQVLENKQLPAAEKVLREASNDMLSEHAVLETGEEKRVIFHGRKQGEAAPYGVAFEMNSKKGYGGNIGIMVGFDTTSGDLLGIFVTTHAETPGVGARAAEEGPFTEQFRNLSQDTQFQVKQEGGPIDALTGATVTSKAVCDAVQSAVAFYSEHEGEIRQLVANRGGEQ